MIALNDSLIMEWLNTLPPSSPAVKYALTEYERGIQYYEKRVKVLGLQGDRALDAGCGVGNWSLALAKTFDRVDAIEYDWERLNILNELLRDKSLNTIFPCLGSIERLPYDDNSFDTVFCNGVFFVTRYQETIAEFKRVLKPGGFLYLTFDSKEWWNHLIFNRGPKEPNCIAIGCEALLNRAIRLLDELKFEHFPRLYDESEKASGYTHWKSFQDFVRIMKIRFSKKLTLWDMTPIIRLLQKWLDGSKKISLQDVVKIHLNFLAFSNSVIAAFDQHATLDKTISELILTISTVYTHGTEEQKTRLARDISSRLVFNVSNYTIQIQSHSFEPYEMVSFVESYDFREIGTAWEGHLIVEPKIGVQKPIYDHNLGVYEMLAQLNQYPFREIWSDPEFFIENARNSPFRFSSMVEKSVLSNHSIRYPYLFPLSDHISLSGSLSEDQNDLKRLVESVTKESSSEKEAFYKLYCFIQDALFHHPVFQLVDEFGSFTANSKLILLSGVGRCSHVSKVVSDLFSILGYKTRITQFYKHVSAEVLVEGRWLIVDPDTFKAGIYPKSVQGKWLTVDEAKENPHLLDAIPSIGLALDFRGQWAKNLFGETVTGYIDTGLPWERPYISYIYMGGELKCPPTPPSLNCKKINSGLNITATMISNHIQKIKLVIDTQSRKWSYTDYPDKNYLSQPRGEVFSGYFSPNELRAGVNISGQFEKLYINAYSYDAYMLENPSVYCWLGDEVLIKDIS